MVINDDAFLVINNGGKVVLENSASNALQTLGTGGNILTASEDDEVIWDIGTATGTYTLPWTTSSSVKIPLELDITSAGTGSGSFHFSTYPTANDNTPYPTGVTNTNSEVIGSADASAYAIDRFWIISPESYTATPDATLSFTYDPTEMGGTNTITEANLQAQTWDSGNTRWSNSLFGTQSGSAVSNAVVPSANFFSAWTLVSNDVPLPVELISFLGELNDKDQVQLSWVTISEENNDHFVVEKSYDGIDFQPVVFIKGMGTTSEMTSYAALDDEVANGQSYYRLKQVDFDGQYSYSQVILIEKLADEVLLAYPNPFSDQLFVTTNQNSLVPIQIRVFNALGELSQEHQMESNQATLNTATLPQGMYIVIISTEDRAVYKELKLSKL